MSFKTVYDGLGFVGNYLTGGKIGKSQSEITNKTWLLLQRIELSMLQGAKSQELGRLAHVMKDSAQDEVFGSNAKAGYFKGLFSAVELKQLDEKYNFENLIKELDKDKTNPEYVEKAKNILLEMKPIGIFEQRLRNSAP